MPEKKIEEIEILRGFAILAVVALHVIGTHAADILGNKTLLNYFMTVFLTGVNQFSSFAVPLFILISGFVLGSKYKGNYARTTYYKKRTLAIIPQYVVFSLLYILYAHYSLPEKNPISIYSFLFKLLTGSAYFHFWFFLLIIQFYILFPLINNIVDRYNDEKAWIRVLVIVYILQISWKAMAVNFLADAEFVGAAMRIFIIRFFLSSPLYFILGIFISRHFDAVRSGLHQTRLAGPASGIAVLCGLLSYMSFIQYDQTSAVRVLVSTLEIILSPPLHILIFILLFRISVRIVQRKTFVWSAAMTLGKYSFGIYLIHVLVLEGVISVSRIIWKNHYINWEYYMIGFIITVTCSVILLKLATCLPYGSYLVGVKRRPMH